MVRKINQTHIIFFKCIVLICRARVPRTGPPFYKETRRQKNMSVLNMSSDESELVIISILIVVLIRVQHGSLADRAASLISWVRRGY